MATILDIKVPWWEEHLLWPVERVWEYIVKDIPFEIKTFWQRGRQGWADSDLWALEDYLARIIGETLKKLAKHHEGYPQDMKSDKDWVAWLNKMAKTFESYRKLDEKFKPENWNKEYNRHIKEMRKLFDHFGSLWD